MKVYGLFRERSKINQILCAVLINLPVFVYGASIGWMSPMTLLLQSNKSPRGEPLSSTEVSIMAAVPYIICPLMDIVMVVLSDRFGRKLALLFISLTNAFAIVLERAVNNLNVELEAEYIDLSDDDSNINWQLHYLVSWLLLICCYETWALILSRVIMSVAMAGCYVTCPIYTKEISDNKIRGTLGCFVILFQTCGNLFLYVIGDLLSYDTVNCICFALPILHVLMFLAMPESPSFLVKKEEIEKAVRVIAWLRCTSEDDIEVKEELQHITKEQKNDEGANSFLLKSILTDKVLFKAFRIAIIATLAREVCGAIPVLNFAGEIFTMTTEGSAITISPNQQAMILGTVQVIGSILASSVVERVGRKPLLFVTSLLSGLSMCLLGSWFLLQDYGVYAPSWIPLLTLCLCIFCDASGLQPISIVLTGEIFSFKYRGTVLALAMALASVSDFIQLLFFKPVAAYIGIHASFYFFGAVCILMAVYVLAVIPETKARSIEDIYKDLIKSKKNETK